MKKLFFLFVLALLTGLSQKIYSQYECAGDIEVENECGYALFRAIDFVNCSYGWFASNDTACLSNEETFYTAESGCYTLIATGNSTGCYAELGYYLEISEPCDTTTVDTTCCVNCYVYVEEMPGCGEKTLIIYHEPPYDEDCEYGYAWKDGPTTQTRKVYNTGTYQYRAFTEYCDSGWKSVYVYVPPLPTVNISGNNKVCAGGTVLLTANTTAQGVLYKWSNGAVTRTTEVTGAGIYTVTITDVYGCIATATKVVTEYPTPTVTISGKTEVCMGESTTLTAFSTTCNSCFLWSTGETTKSILVFKGTYTVTVTDPVTCCTSTATVTVTEIYVPVPDVYASLGDNGGVYLSSWNSYQTLWSTEEEGQTIIVFESGVYTAQGIDENGCLSDPSCPIPVFIEECDSTTSGTTDCDTVYIHDTLYIHDTVYIDNPASDTLFWWEDPSILSECSKIGITNNWGIIYGDTIFPASSQFFLKAPFNSTGWKWRGESQGGTDQILANTKFNNSYPYYYYLDCVLGGYKFCFEFSYTIGKNDNTTGNEEVETRSEPIVYPNPTSGKVTIEFDIEDLPIGPYFIHIMNINGQEVKTPIIIKH